MCVLRAARSCHGHLRRVCAAQGRHARGPVATGPGLWRGLATVSAVQTHERTHLRRMQVHLLSVQGQVLLSVRRGAAADPALLALHRERCVHASMSLYASVTCGLGCNGPFGSKCLGPEDGVASTQPAAASGSSIFGRIIGNMKNRVRVLK